MIQLTEEMAGLINNARESGYPCIVATGSPTASPTVALSHGVNHWG